MMKSETFYCAKSGNFQFALTINKWISKVYKKSETNSEYYKLDNENSKSITPKVICNKNGLHKFRNDYNLESYSHSHFDKSTKTQLSENHKHVYQYNDNGQRIGEIAMPLD